MTFQADHLNAGGEVSESALDHIYFSSDLGNKIITDTLKNSSSDHLPIVCEIRSIPKSLPYTKKVEKRSLRNFSEERWNDCLSKKDWKELENCKTVDKMVDIFSKNRTNFMLPGIQLTNHLVIGLVKVR